MREWTGREGEGRQNCGHSGLGRVKGKQSLLRTSKGTWMRRNSMALESPLSSSPCPASWGASQQPPLPLPGVLSRRSGGGGVITECQRNRDHLEQRFPLLLPMETNVLRGARAGTQRCSPQCHLPSSPRMPVELRREKWQEQFSPFSGGHLGVTLDTAVLRPPPPRPHLPPPRVAANGSAQTHLCCWKYHSGLRA